MRVQRRWVCQWRSCFNNTVHEKEGTGGEGRCAGSVPVDAAVGRDARAVAADVVAAHVERGRDVWQQVAAETR